MIIRSENEVGSPGPDSVVHPVAPVAQFDSLLSDRQLQFEITKEIARSNRRSSGREFAIIKFPDIHTDVDQAQLRYLASKARQRIRISDSIGWLQNELVILLPETDRDGAMALANELVKEVLPKFLSLETEIVVYPWDDPLVSEAHELNGQNGFHDSAPPTPGEEHSVTRIDRGHPSRGTSQRTGGKTSSPSSAHRVSRRKSNHQGPFTALSPTPWWKRTVDVVGSGTGLILLSPLFLAASVAIKLTSPGPVFFRQQREGKDGNQFGILKFRTMVVDAEAQQDSLRDKNERDGPAFKLENDPRITSIGRYLRKSCVDELPQLFNVLVGQMSLVGPRPLPVNESHGCTAWQRARLTVLPGLTCTWQAHGGRDTKFEEWMRMDLEYIQKRSFWFDLKLITATAFLAVMHRGSV